MYIPSFNKADDIPVLHAFIKENPLSTWAAFSEGEIVVNHIPFVLQQDKGELGTLVGHVARANPIWKSQSATQESVVVFHGDSAYISPSWYPSKHEHGKAVPTWNYAVVHAHGAPRFIDDREWLLAHVNEITDIHESVQNLPWKVADAPAEFIEKMLKAIVGVEIPLTRIQGKMKLGQNRPHADQLGMLAGLTSRGDKPVKGLADLLNSHIQQHQ